MGVLLAWEMLSLMGCVMRDSQAQDAVREGPVAGGGGCVLVVDDSESFVALLDAFLSSEAGCRVASCGGGREALELARRLQPAVILLDIVLPDLQGHEVCRQLAEHPETAGIPVILMSGMPPRNGWEAWGNVVRFFAKPFPLGALVEQVRGLLAGTERAA